MSTDDRSGNPPVLPIAIAVAVIVLLALAWWHGGQSPRAEARALSTELEQTRVHADEAVRERSHLAALLMMRQAQVAVLEANMALDRRNFGTANEHLGQAEQALAGVNANELAIDPARLQALREAIAQTDLTVAVDLAEQRQQLALLVDELHALITPR